jgi:membrane carboxypeptidase/penicillin-binding protein
LNAGGPLVITDRHGKLLRSVPTSSGRPGRNAWVDLKDVPGAVVGTVLRSEDVNFYEHAGVDPVGIARACVLNLSRGRLAFGGSTLTMQLVKLVHHAGQPRTLENKLKEMVLALRLERAASKQQILEHYLNRVYYGNGAYGIEAAAQRQLEGEDTAELEHGEAEALLETQGRELLRGCEKIACPRGETQFWGKAEDVPVAKPQGSETGRTGSTANRIGLTAEVGLRLSARR